MQDPRIKLTFHFLKKTSYVPFINMQVKQEKDREHFKTPNAVPPIIAINEHMPQSTRRES